MAIYNLVALHLIINLLRRLDQTRLEVLVQLHAKRVDMEHAATMYAPVNLDLREKIVVLIYYARVINRKIITQGNLDPVLLSSDNLSAIKNEVYRILDLTQKRCHIFNVGHGLIPEVKIENIKYTIKLIDSYH